MSRTVLALSGWKQSGKDTLTDYLVAEYNFKRISFAARLKDLVASQYNIPREFMDSPSLKEMPLTNLPVTPSDASTQRLQEMFLTELRNGFWTPRALCILEGSVKRAVMSQYWTRSCMEEIVNNSTDNYIITDMRYRSEADTFRTFFPGGKVVRVDRFDTSPTNDPSERDMDTYEFDYTISNRSTHEELQKNADQLILSLSSSF